MIVLIVLIATSAPLLAPFNPAEQHLDLRLLSPVWTGGGRASYFLGTDPLGRDVLSRLIYGSRISIVVGLSAVALAGGIGVSIGVAAGFAGGWLDNLLMRLTDAFLAIPFIVLALAVVGAVGPSVSTVIVVIGFANWMEYARVVRGEVLAARDRDFVEAARAIGASPVRIALRHILPNVMSSVIVLATLNVATAIIVESALSFLGVGIQPPTVTWGGMLSSGRDYIATAWWLAAFPGLAIAITVLSILFLGDWLREVMDPRLRRS
jgi:peptide/nickel transport system permease protein